METLSRYPAVETRQLEMFKRLTEAAQALEQQLKLTTCPRNEETHPLLDKTAPGVQPQIPGEETKESHDNRNALHKERIPKANETPPDQQSKQGDEIKTTLIPNTSIPKVEEN